MLKSILQSLPLAVLVYSSLGSTSAIAQSHRGGTIQSESFLLAQAFKAPSNREVAARRRLPPPRASGDCSVGDVKLASLIPGEEFGMPLAASSSPIFYVYVPAVNGDYVEFSIFNGRNALYQAQFETPATPGIVALSLPPELNLVPGKTPNGKLIAYQWYFNVVCDQSDRSNDLKTNGWVHAVQDGDAIVQDASATTLAEAGFWYDALAAALFEGQGATNNLLESVGLTDFMDLDRPLELTPLAVVPES
ncbi:MAG: DUF928 domain-containing protein [Synechococcaceae cyanobacterium RL_1_2]|nr:DUF928 domain-containing protein [Synechococcaceae cyanobacterium RL_1_2]